MAEKSSFKNKRLTDDQLSHVSGGFVSETGYSLGETIICPRCGNEDIYGFYQDSDVLSDVQKDLFTCQECGQKFAAAFGYGITEL